MFLADHGSLMSGLEFAQNLMDQVLRAVEQNWLGGDDLRHDAVFSLAIVIRGVE
jgi:hypothetical protein